VTSSHRRLVVAAQTQWWKGEGFRGLMTTESCPPFKVPELSGVPRRFVEGATPALSLCILNSEELVITGLLKGTPVGLRLGGYVLPAGYAGLVDSRTNLVIPPRLTTPLAVLAPWGRGVGDVSKLSCEAANRVVDLSKEIE
jgi:hypothetical protein